MEMLISISAKLRLSVWPIVSRFPRTNDHNKK